jgi:uncharacterized protein (DUF2336 family)
MSGLLWFLKERLTLLSYANMAEKNMADNPKQRLSASDLQGIARENPDDRAKVVAKVAVEYKNTILTDNERDLAEEIFRLAAQDLAVQVRQLLAEELKSFELVPADIIKTLASNSDDGVALPIIEYSKVLTDDDLQTIINTDKKERMLAIARREMVSESISERLIEKQSEDIASTLAGNKGAKISVHALEKMLETHKQSDTITSRLSLRTDLPLEFAEKLIVQVSSHLQQNLMTQYKISEETLQKITKFTREKATLSVVNTATPAAQVERLVKHLRSNHRLTDSIILRALCTGDIRFFEYAMAELTGLSITNTQLLVHDSNEETFQKFYAKAKLSKDMYKGFRVALDVYHAIISENRYDDPQALSRAMIERILTKYSDLGAENIDHLLGRLEATNKTSAVSA